MNLPGYCDIASSVCDASEYKFATLTPALFISEIIRGASTVRDIWAWDSKISIFFMSAGLAHEISGVGGAGGGVGGSAGVGAVAGSDVAGVGEDLGAVFGMGDGVAVGTGIVGACCFVCSAGAGDVWTEGDSGIIGAEDGSVVTCVSESDLFSSADCL